MKLGEQWSQSVTYRRLKDKGSVTFHIINTDIKKTTTFFDENKKPIREDDLTFGDRMEKWQELTRAKYQLDKDGKKDTQEYKEIDEQVYKLGPSIKYMVS